MSRGALFQSQWFRHFHRDENVDTHVLIARHYKHVLTIMFGAGHERVVLVEEDLVVAPGFLRFFAAVAPVVDSDASLIAASSWNDHGFSGMVSAGKCAGPGSIEAAGSASCSHRFEAGSGCVHRAEHFPGLGWLCTRRLWEELEPQWPDYVWDVWLRAVTRGRHTLVPEVSLVRHDGSEGSSMHLVDYNKWFNSTVLSVRSDWSDIDETRLTAASYKRDLWREVDAATSTANLWDIYEKSKHGSSWRICYEATSWRSVAGYLGLWPPIPLEDLPPRGLSFDGVSRIRWMVPVSSETAADVAMVTVFLVAKSTADPGCIGEFHFNQPLPPPPRYTLPEVHQFLERRLRFRRSAPGQSCAAACTLRSMWCAADYLPWGRGGHLAGGHVLQESNDHVSASSAVISTIRTCPALVEDFGGRCVGGCLEVPAQAPVSRLLPALWTDEGSSESACLLTSSAAPFDCALSSPRAERLCPCVCGERGA